MTKDIRQEAEDLLSEPFETYFGLCYACVEKLMKLDPAEQEEFLCFVLENQSLISNKKVPGIIEHQLETKLLASLIQEQIKDLKILVQATVSIFPPTAELAKYILGAMEIHKDAEHKAIVLWYIIRSNLLPYAPYLPQSEHGSVPEIGEAEFRAHRKNYAMILRLVNFGEGMTFLQKADTLRQILPEKEPAKTYYLALFLAKYREWLYQNAKKAAFEELRIGNKAPADDPVPDDDDGGDPPQKPPKNGNGEN